MTIPTVPSFKRPLSPSRLAGLAVGSFAVVGLVFSSYYIVDPNEMAAVRRLGTVTTTEPIGPGFHLKLPLVDQVDRLPVSIDSFRGGDLHVHTIDNQSVDINVNLTYRIPPQAVMRLLYGVGRSGNLDIAGNMAPVVADRAQRVFAKRNTITISEEREQIAGEIRQLVSERLNELFGIDVLDVQLSKIQYSPSFIASVEAAVKAKNDAVAASNTVNRINFEADQARAKAKGDADAAAIRAEGEKRATITKAEAEAQALRLTAEANAAALRLRGEAVTLYPQLINLSLSEKWTGQPPATIVNGQGTVPFFPLIAPAAAGDGKSGGIQK